MLTGHVHWYERNEVDGLPYLTNGAGGATLAEDTVIAKDYSKVRRQGEYGAMKCQSSCTELKMQFYTIAGELVDTVTISKQ